MKIRELQAMKKTEAVKKLHYVMYCRKSSEPEDRQIASIGDQHRELGPIIASKNLSLAVKPFNENMSAKSPGRPKFNEMVNLINRGDIKGIICWKINRLFRNPQDEGMIRQLLSDGRLEEIITPSKTYYTADSDFTLAVEGAQGQKFITDLIQDTKRGLRSKIDKGWLPALAPVGYVNNKHKLQGEKDISSHPVYFSLMRKIFELALTGNFSYARLTDKANELGIRTVNGLKLSRITLIEALNNPFFAGKFRYDGELYDGAHKPMLTSDEFDLLQDIFHRGNRPRYYKHQFPFTGLIVCGECGLSITADKHTKTYKNGKSQDFIYYRCTKKSKVHKCQQSFIPAKQLEQQISDFLQTIKISPKFADWAISCLNAANKQQQETREARHKALQSSYGLIVSKIDSLLELKLSPSNKDGNILSDQEFGEKKKQLVVEKDKFQQQLNSVDRHVSEWTDLASKTFSCRYRTTKI